MDPVTVIGVISAGVPLVSTLFKKIFKTEEIKNEGAKKIVHKTIPLITGIAASILICKTGGCDASAIPCPEQIDWLNCVLTGFAGGAGASYIRDFDKNILGIAGAVVKLFTTEKKDA